MMKQIEYVDDLYLKIKSIAHNRDDMNIFGS